MSLSWRFFDGLFSEQTLYLFNDFLALFRRTIYIVCATFVRRSQWGRDIILYTIVVSVMRLLLVVGGLVVFFFGA